MSGFLIIFVIIIIVVFLFMYNIVHVTIYGAKQNSVREKKFKKTLFLFRQFIFSFN